jgi:DNA (cytosine-5)-methyltransferase 1
MPSPYRWCAVTFNYLSLFSGVGGLDLGLDRAGWNCVGQVEIDAWCRTVLDDHWPGVPKHDDVRTAPQWWDAEPRPTVRLVAGGYPCQPFSRAGRRRGVADERWGWPWFCAVVRAVRPQYVLVENVPTLIDDADAFGWMLGDLAEDGFDADWTVISACAVGAPHVRERMFLVAHPAGGHGPSWLGSGHGGSLEALDGPKSPWGHPEMGMAAAGGSDRVADGIPDPLESARIKGLGNAVVPQVGELVGRLILDHAAAGARRARSDGRAGVLQGAPAERQPRRRPTADAAGRAGRPVTELPVIPASCAHRPTVGGLVAPFVNIRLADGGVDFRSPHQATYERCWREGLCQTCGERLGYTVVFFGGPRQLHNRHFDEPPLCTACAVYASKACPMVAGRMSHYADRERLSEGRRGHVCPDASCDCGGFRDSDPNSYDASGEPAHDWFAVYARAGDWQLTSHEVEVSCSDRGCLHKRLLINGGQLTAEPRKVVLVSTQADGRVWRRVSDGAS